MPAVQYPFIDIAVHERVKEHFARGEAIVLFSLDLSEVLWANGAGARLFGKPVLYDLIEDGPNPNDVTFRQVEATGRQLQDVGSERRFLIRIPTGFQRIAVQAIVERIRLTSSVDALLFAAPLHTAPQKTATIAAEMLTGFDDPDTHMAVLGDEGEILAASAGFASLGLTAATARTLVDMAGNHPDRLVKRPVPTGKGYLPAAIGKVSDAPPMHLLFAVETILGNMGPTHDFPETPARPVEEPGVEEILSTPQSAFASDDPASVPAAETSPVETVIEAIDEEPEAQIVADGEGIEQESESAPAYPEAEETVESAPEPELPQGEPVVAALPAAMESSAAADTGAPVAEEEHNPSGEAVSAPEVFQPNRSARATRFVWKIDADGYFSEVSPELAAAVGPHAADLSGVAFRDIASLLDLDPEGKIADLLGRRDTWSGKTIYWPVEGTSLKAPVDLAALPTYRRNREFDGFRGFGIVRLSDAVEDPHSIGLTLGTAPAAPAAPTLEDSEPFHLPPVDQTEDSADAVGAEETDTTALEDAEPDTGPITEPLEPEALFEASSVAEESTDPEQEPPAAKNDLHEEARVEPPVLHFASTDLPDTDKVIRLAEHRLRGRDGLTPGEQEAFREIARQLEPFLGEEDAGDPAASAEAAAPASSETVPPETVPEEPVADDVGHPAEPEEAAAEPVTAKDTSEAEGVDANAPYVAEQLEILASSIPARTAMNGGLTAEVIDEIPVALLIHAGDTIIHANPEFLRLTGYRTAAELEAVGGLDSLLHHRDLEDMPERSGGLSLVKADDSLVPVTARLQSVRWEDANALLLALIPSGPQPQSKETETVVDPDEERLSARVDALQVEVEELRSILETATDGVVVIGTDGEIRSMNRSASALFDYDEAETRGKPFVMLFAHESHRAVADYLGGLTGHGVASVLNDGREVIGREASGGFIPLFMTIGRLSASNGFCAVIRDITQWKRTEEDLKNAKRAAETANAHKSDFLARVSHEIRTPLNAIIGFSDMMSIEHFGPIGHPRYVEYANDIARSGRLVLDIVNDLLDISKIEAGEMDLEFTAVGLNDAVSEAVSLVQPQAQANRVIIRTAFSESVPDVVADLRSIKQIVLNILANGIRFTQPGGQIVVSTAYEPTGSVVLRIRDTGVGMTRAELEQAMKPFRQVTPGTRKRGDGTGLGLPLTKAMVDANRANFAIHSTPNEGTLVEITFPSPRVLAN